MNVVPHKERLRLGACGDLESATLICGLDRPPWSAQVALDLFDDRDELLTALDNDRLDGALLPSHSLASRASRLEIVPGLAVSSRGAYPAAALLHRPSLGAVASIADRSQGHAAGALCRVLFVAAGLSPAMEPFAAGVAEALARFDAVVIGGVEAVTAAVPDGVQRLDLGLAWLEQTRLPFVWSLWGVRPGVVDRPRYARLHSARSLGRRHREAVATRFAGSGPVAGTPVDDALAGPIRWRLGRAELDGLRAFWLSCVGAGLVDSFTDPALVSLDRSARGCGFPSGAARTIGRSEPDATAD